MRKNVPGFEGLYEVDTEGNVYSIRKNIILKPYLTKKGYLHYCLYKYGKRYMFLGHRIVANTFIPNPNNYPIINHKDENKKNNSISNLEWCTHSYNVRYSVHNHGEHYKKLAELHKQTLSKEVMQINKEGNVIAIYESGIEASRRTGINKGNIVSAYTGKRKTAGGYIWKQRKEHKNAEI